VYYLLMVGRLKINGNLAIETVNVALLMATIMATSVS